MTKNHYHYKLSALGWLATVATSLAFIPALSQQRCIVYGAGFSAAVVATGVVLRRLHCPIAVVVLAQVVVAIELLVVTFGEHIKYAVWPTRATLGTLRSQVDVGMEVARTYAAPAPPNVGLLILVVALIVLIAVLVDFFAAGLHRPPLAGLPLLALYAVPVAALPSGVPFYGFVPGAVGFIALLMADERHRVISWGRIISHPYVTGKSADGMDISGLAAAGRRISTAALLAAVFVPFVVPVVSTAFWGRNVGRSSAVAGNTLTFADPMVSLVSSLRRPHPVDLLRVASDVTPEYLRLAVLDQPGPNAWQSSTDLNQAVPLSAIARSPRAVSPAVRTSPHTMTISILNDFPPDSAWLPVPNLLRYLTIRGGSDWAYVPADQTVGAKAEFAVTAVGAYDLAYDMMSPTAAQLRSAGSPPGAIQQRYGTVPQNLPPVLSTTALRVTAGATNDYQRALDLQDFFRNRTQFSYDLHAGYGYGYQAMAKFLRDRRGFCQHFAATMAMMARTLGIPSRIVVGFLQPERTNGKSSVFTSKNVHSWPELYFQGVGWVRFEPTQGVSAPYPQWAEAVHHRRGHRSTSPSTAPFIDKSTRSVPTTTTPSTAASSADASGGFGGALPSKNWLIPLGALAVVLLPASLRLSVRRNRLTRPVDPGAAAEASWRELRDFLRDLHLPWSGSMTPRARQRFIAPLIGEDSDALSALQRLTNCVERARYAESVAPDLSPASDATSVMAAIARGTDNGSRIRAFLWPSSLLPDLRTGWARLRGRQA